MARYRIVTLIDITRSQPARDSADKIKIGQQANFNSFLQAIGMRSNVEWNHDPLKCYGRIPVNDHGKATHWIWEFDCEREDVFLKNNDPVALLAEDLHGVPVIPLLENSADISPAAIQTEGNKINTWVNVI